MVDEVQDFPNVDEIGIVARPQKRHDHQGDFRFQRVREDVKYPDAMVTRVLQRGHVPCDLDLLGAIWARLDGYHHSIFASPCVDDLVILQTIKMLMARKRGTKWVTSTVDKIESSQ